MVEVIAIWHASYHWHITIPVEIFQSVSELMDVVQRCSRFIL